MLVFLTLLSLLSSNAIAEVKLSERVSAAKQTAQSLPACQKIAPFYWEIGNGTQSLASGSTGDGSVKADTNMIIASASKWVFGAYVVQKLYGKIDSITQKYLKMMSGYTHLNARSCIFTRTLEDCFTHDQNSTYSAEYDGKFFYNGGHFQKWAVDHGMGKFDRTQLKEEYQKQLGADFNLSFGPNQLAGGIKTSAQDYAGFLRKILSKKLLIFNFLGANATCTSPRSCSQAARSPVPEQWHYSYAHWIEDDPKSGDGAFSSPGAFGFYPWIDASKTYYGIISRRAKPHRDNFEIGQGYASVLCGRKMRKAFMSGVAVQQ